jgi:nicotinate-nucleotide adenylyltransferase
MDMVRAAIALNGSFSASDREIERGGVSYTIDTVEDLQREHPQSELFLLIGSDQAIEFVRWHRWEDICRVARLCIVRRPFLLTNEMELRTTERLTVDGREPIWINAPLLEISSTEIRHRVSKGATINYLTVKAVRDYIDSHGLYRSDSQ